MLAQLRRSAVLCVICLVLFGLVYPLLGVGLSQLFFKHQADGSITANGSTLIGQNWSDTEMPGASARQLRVPGATRSTSVPTRMPTRRPRARPVTPVTTPWWPTGRRGVGRNQPRAPLGRVEELHQDPHRLLEGPRGRPHLGPGHHVGERA